MNDVIGKVLPWITGALTGGVPALLGMAAQEVGKAIGVEIEPTQKAVESAIVGATPEQLLAIKEAENRFSLRMQELGYQSEKDLYELEVKDRDSARAREIAVRDRMPSALAVLVTLGFFGVLGWMLAYGVPSTGGEALLVMLGSLGTAWSGIIAYFFGSSHGSRNKDDMLKDLKK